MDGRGEQKSHETEDRRAPAEKTPTQWYLRPVAIFVAILLLGPFAIPLVWLSGALKTWHKALITAALVISTIWFIRISSDIYAALSEEMKTLQAIIR